MANEKNGDKNAPSNAMGAMLEMQANAVRTMMEQFSSFASVGQADAQDGLGAGAIGAEEMKEWASTAQDLQRMWLGFLARKGQSSNLENGEAANPFNPAQWLLMTQGMAKQTPLQGESLIKLAQKSTQDSLELWQGVFARLQASNNAPDEKPELPRKDRRFADPAWQDHPGYAMLHQTYLMLAEYFTSSVKNMDGIDKGKRKQLQFAVQSLLDAMSPDNFLATNPVVMKRTMETRGQNLVRGMQHLIRDLERGQLTHSDPDAFTLGENMATTPGKVVYETPLYQLIQYSPSTEKVLEVPLVIFPPWINRFYILDLNPKKSFIKWVVDQGISVFVVSWKSADASLKDVVWDDYITSQIDAVEQVCKRLKVPHAHTIGYCVAGTTLAATLAVLAQRGQADIVKSATFFTAQVDFEKSGELKNFIDDGPLSMIEKLSGDGYLDGRYLAATFNSLRSKDLIWNYVVNNYLLGEDYPAFDLLHWNGDVTNLPAKWHGAYLRDLYRDNKMVQPGALTVDGTPIDLTKIETPAYLQAGKEDHIAPAESVWRATQHFSGPVQFLLAGSGHIAGVVNPPASNKYQYWTGHSNAASLEDFVAGAEEHPGSWWPHWLEWLNAQDSKQVPATGKRKPGGRGDKVIEDAPGRYVKTR